MSNIVNIPDRGNGDRPRIDEEARAWVVQLDGEPTGSEIREFRTWLQQSPMHRQAFRDAAGAWRNMDALAGLWDSVPGIESAAWNRSHVRRFVRPALAGLTLGSALILALYAYLPATVWQVSEPYVAEFSSAIGEVRTLPLPDGSRVSLNTGSRLTVAMGDEARLIRLDSGEAWFEVARDPDRPFVVYAGRFAVQAIGTAFALRVLDDSLDLTVTAGRVEVASLSAPVEPEAGLDLGAAGRARFRVPVEQGRRVTFRDGIELAQRIEPAEIERKLSWRDGMLIFNGDPLERVVAEISRYTPVKIVISDSDIRDLRFGGYFRAGDVAPILETLEENFGIRVERINDDLIYLSRWRQE
jgi:transmembrane sensor